MNRSKKPLLQLREIGQSPWCDQLSRQMLASGQLAQLVSEQGIVGLTSNPTIFQRALAAGDWYDDQIRQGAAEGLDNRTIYTELVVRDIKMAADLLHPVYEMSDRVDGYVSLEVSPDLAYDAEASVSEARQLWRAVGRPNLMVKIPATRAGLPAITRLLAEGINVNVTLIFGLERYREVLEAHAAGLSQARDRGLGLRRISSVASFFVSRVDTLVDRLLDLQAGRTDDLTERQRLLDLKGRAAIANARAARAIWEQWLAVDPMRDLLASEARPQRLLWASTSTKNPAYRDVLYVEELIGPDTVNTMPLETVAAFNDHGQVRGATLTEDAAYSAAMLQALALAGIEMESVADDLEAAGVGIFAESFAQLLAGLETKVEALKVKGAV